MLSQFLSHKKMNITTGRASLPKQINNKNVLHVRFQVSWELFVSKFSAEVVLFFKKKKKKKRPAASSVKLARVY